MRHKSFPQFEGLRLFRSATPLPLQIMYTWWWVWGCWYHGNRLPWPNSGTQLISLSGVPVHHLPKLAFMGNKSDSFSSARHSLPLLSQFVQIKMEDRRHTEPILFQSSRLVLLSLDFSDLDVSYQIPIMKGKDFFLLQCPPPSRPEALISM